MACPICRSSFAWTDSVSINCESILYGPPKPLGDGFVRSGDRPDNLEISLALNWIIRKPVKGHVHFHSRSPLEVEIVSSVRNGVSQLFFCSPRCLRAFFTQCVDALERSRKVEVTSEAKALQQKVKKARAALKAKKPGAVPLLDFIEHVEKLGYQSSLLLDAGGIDIDTLLKDAAASFERLSEKDQQNAVLLNNLGVLFLNCGKKSEARSLIKRASALDPKDANIHENLRLLDILQNKPKPKWHQCPKGLRRGKRTLVGYFDPHGM